jgi:hypothetical protein
VVEENNFTELESLCTVSVVEVESHFLRIAMNLRECDSMPEIHSKVELSVSNFVPSSGKHIKGVDAHF